MNGQLPPIEPVSSPQRTVDDLTSLLRQERAAIAKLDRSQLEAIAERRSGLLHSLRSVLAQGSIKMSDADRDHFDREVRRLLAEAQVNAALLQDATAAIAETLGIQPTQGTYDSRGKVSQAGSALAKKHV